MKKKLIVITGASSGFGKEMAHLFSSKGQPLLLLGRRTELMTDFNLPNTIVEKVDVSQKASFVAAIKKAEALYDPVDLLINNAGQMLLGELGSQEPLEWQRMIEANLLGTLNGISAVLPQMKVAETDLLSHTTDAEIKEGYNEWKETVGGVALDPQEVVQSVAFMYERPQNVSVRELVIASTRQDN